MKHQDYIYLKEDYYNNPKETFKFVTSKMKDVEGKSILDIGCAKGEFLYYLQSQYQFAEYCGLDYSEILIKEAKSHLKSMQFYVDSAETFSLNKQFDVITILGLIYYFDDLEKLIKNVSKHLIKNGKLYMLAMFNPYDVDVIVRYRDNEKSSEFETGWNMHSIPTFKKTLEKNNLIVIVQEQFVLPFEIEEGDDPCRSWSIKVDDKQYFRNGLGQIWQLMFFEITPKGEK